MIDRPTLAACMLAGAGTLLLLRPRPRVPALAPADAQPGAAASRARPLWALGGGLAAVVWLPWPAGMALAPLAVVMGWVVAGRIEPPAVRRERREAEADLPHLVSLLAAALRAGGAPEAGLQVACRALPGAAATRLAALLARLALGTDPVTVWSDLARDPVLGPLGRTLARAHHSGAPVTPAIERLAADLARDRRAGAEDRARAVGVKAAVPLGLCLLPSFLVLGVVPVVAGLARSLMAR